MEHVVVERRSVKSRKVFILKLVSKKINFGAQSFQSWSKWSKCLQFQGCCFSGASLWGWKKPERLPTWKPPFAENPTKQWINVDSWNPDQNESLKSKKLNQGWSKQILLASEENQLHGTSNFFKSACIQPTRPKIKFNIYVDPLCPFSCFRELWLAITGCQNKHNHVCVTCTENQSQPVFQATYCQWLLRLWIILEKQI